MLRRSFATSLLILFPCFALADPGAQVQSVKLSNPPVIDGVIHEDTEYAGVPMEEGMYEQTGVKATEETVFWLAYDDNFVYFAARMRDSQPSGIKATEYQTNVSLTSDDFVELDLDLNGSLANFNTFLINPKGATNLTLAGGRAAKREWSGEFVAKARVTETGWEAEARIPWQLMQLPASGRRDVRFNVSRNISRLNRIQTWIYTSGSLQGIGRWHDVFIPRQLRDQVLQLLPYGYLGGAEHEGLITNSGLDFKYPLTDQALLVGSINPDFRNIENDILSLDFSRFERLAGETRPFFQEGSQYSNSALFASQRISGFDFGLNTYGRLNDHTTYSLIDTHRFGKENDFVFNGTYDPDPNLSWRATVSSLNQEGLDNSGYLLRLSKQFGDYNLFLRGMGTDDTQLGKGQEQIAVLTYNRQEWNISGGYQTVSPSFLPRLGFFPETDYKGTFYNVFWTKLLEKGAISSMTGSASGLDFQQYNGGFYRNERTLEMGVGFRNGLGLDLLADYSNFFSDHDKLYSFNIVKPQGERYRRFSVGYDWGEQAGSEYRLFRASAAYRPIQKLQLNLTSQFLDYRGNTRQVILSGVYDLGNDRSLSGRAVQRGDDVNFYLAYRRSGNKGIEYYLILGDPNARRFRNSVILKAIFPIDILVKKAKRPTGEKGGSQPSR